MKKNAAKGYEKTKPKQTQSPQRVKMMQSVYLQRIMKNNADMGYEKANPIKPNFKRRAKTHLPKISCLTAQTFLCWGHDL